MKVNWNFPNIIWSGENRINDLFLACSELNIKKPLFVTDKDLINFELLNKKEKNYLFNYHLNIYLKLSKYLNKKERKWLASFI